MNPTLRYYESNAADVAASYEQVDFSRVVDSFTAHLPPGARLLDLGCGSGRDSARLLRSGYNVTAVDGSAAMLARALALHPELAGRTVHAVLPGVLPFEADSFDGAMSWAVIMHLREEALPDLFAELARVTTRGGLLAYSVNTARAGLDADLTDERGRHFTCLAMRSWEALHEGSGFRTMEREETEDIVGRSGIRWATFFARRD